MAELERLAQLVKQAGDINLDVRVNVRIDFDEGVDCTVVIHDLDDNHVRTMINTEHVYWSYYDEADIQAALDKVIVRGTREFEEFLETSSKES